MLNQLHETYIQFIYNKKRKENGEKINLTNKQ